MDNTHEWCAEGVQPQIQNLKGLPKDQFPWWMEKLRNDETIHVENVSDMPEEAENEKETLRKQNIKSVLVLPVHRNKELAGYIGFDNVKEVGKWSEEAKLTLKIISTVIGNSLENKKAKKELEESEKKYRILSEGSFNGIYLFQDGEFKYVNEAMKKITGYTREELKNMNPFELVHPDHREEFLELTREVLQGSTMEGKGKYEFKALPKDGDPAWFEITSALVEFEGEPAIVSNVANINKRKEEEKKKKEALEDKERIMDTVPDIIYQLDKEGRLVEWNDEFVKVSGYSPRELEGMTAQEFFPDDQKDKISNAMEKAYEEGFVLVEATFLTKSGEKIPYSFTARSIKDEEGSPIGLTGVGRDISERKEAELRFKKLFNAGPDPMFLLDEKGVFQEINKALTELLGFKEEQIIGKQISEVPFLTQQAKTKILENFKKRLNGAEPSPYLIEGKTKDGKQIFAELNAELIEEEGSQLGTVGIARDITELKESEERKDFLNTLLRQDLGSKYQTIQGYLQLIEDADLTEEYQEYLEKANKAGKKVDEILGLANKLEELEKTELEGTKNITKTLNQVTDDIKDLIKKEGVEVEKDYPEKIGRVEGDYSLNLIFSQILLTRIQISNCNKIRIKAREKGQEVLVKITDDGETLPSDIKNMFSGGLYTGKTTGVGGVRYYMIKQIAEHNNAEIEVRDSELGGSGFDIYLSD